MWRMCTTFCNTAIHTPFPSTKSPCPKKALRMGGHILSVVHAHQCNPQKAHGKNRVFSGDQSKQTYISRPLPHLVQSCHVWVAPHKVQQLNFAQHFRHRKGMFFLQQSVESTEMSSLQCLRKLKSYVYSPMHRQLKVMHILYCQHH